MAGWEQLGEVLGGGIDRQGAFQTGMLRSAQTESAIGMARQRQLENIALETKNREREKTRETLAASGMDPRQADLLANVMLGEMGSDFKAGTEGMGELQTQGFRSTLADPTAPLGDQFAAGQGIQGEVLPRYVITGTTAEDLFNRDAPLAPTPVGEADIAADTALAELRDRTPRLGSQSSSGGAETATRPPWAPPEAKLDTGLIWNKNFDPSRPEGPDNPMAVPLSGGGRDPNAPAAAGSRESIFNERSFMSMAQTVPDVLNIMLLPSTANAGFFGIGSRPGESLMRSSVDSLRNRLSGEIVRAYQRQAGQLGRGLAWMESNGVVPNQATLDSYTDSVTIRDGDTGFDALGILANVRQTVEQMTAVKLANPRLPESFKDLAVQYRDAIRAAVPFTVEDVYTLQFGNGDSTLADLVKSKGFAAPSARPAPTPGAAPGVAPAAAAPPPAPPAGAKPGANFPMTNAKGWRKMKDAQGNYAYVGPNGEVEEISSGF